MCDIYTLMSGKVGEAEDIPTNNLPEDPRNSIVLISKPEITTLPCLRPCKAEINSAKEPDKNNSHYLVAQLSTS